MVHWLATAFAGVLAVQAAQHMPGVFILQYHDDHDPGAVLDQIRLKHDVKVRRELDFKLFKGADVLFSNIHTASSAAAEIRAMPGVKRIWPSRRFARPETTGGWTGNGHVGHEAMKRDVDHNDTFSPHVMTQVNLLRDAGYVGKGFKIAIIDSGVDYLHPALGGGFGPGHTVSFGTDLVGDAYNGTNEPVPDADPLDTCSGHGTHVAGIIAAQPDKNPYGIIGAASGVKLGMYRVFGCDGGTEESVVIKAYHQAFEDGADLIHASLGSAGGWSEGSWEVAVSTIVAHGVPCTISTGNDGQNGLFFPGTAADSVGVAAIGSTNNVMTPSLQVKATYSVNGSNPVAFGFTPGLSKRNWTAKMLPLWTPVTNVSGIDDQSIGCDPYQDTTPNLSGYIVLVPRGICSARRKVANAAQWGAKHIMLYNYAPGTSRYSFDKTEFSIGMVPTDLGAEWVKLLLSGAKVDVNMVDVATAPEVLTNANNTLTGGYMSTYTSWGPTFELAIKPQFSAPGGNILSTWPRSRGSYAIESGTSMSGPLAAATFVLLMESTGIRDPGMLGRLFSSTAKQIEYNDQRDNDGHDTHSGMLAPVSQQGAGMIQVFDASRARTVFDVDSLAFNDTNHLVAARNFTITNLSNDTLHYRLGHTPAATAYTFEDDKSLLPGDDGPDLDRAPNELVSGHATLEFFVPSPDGANASDSPESFSIPGGKKRVVSVRVTRPAGLDDGRMPVWSGWIRLTDNNGSKVSLPYQGVTGSLDKRPILDLNGTGVVGANELDLLLGPRTFLIPPAGKSNLTRWSYANDTNQPMVAATLAFGSRLIRADLVPVDVPGAKFNLTTVLGTQTAGQLAGWPAEYVPRGVLTQPWDGQLDDGSFASEGVYKINIKALRIFGDPAKREDYDEAETLKFGIRYAYDI